MKKMTKFLLFLPLVIIVTINLFVLSQYLKDTFFLGPEPDLEDKSILFEAEGDGVQLFWRHYSENNEYKDEYLFDEPIEGDLSDVLLRDDGELWFIVSEDISYSGADIYIYKHDNNDVKEIAFFEEGGGHDLIRVLSHDQFEVIERERP